MVRQIRKPAEVLIAVLTVRLYKTAKAQTDTACLRGSRCANTDAV